MTKKSSLVPLIVRELQVVGLQHSAPDEWPSEGGSNWKTKVEADGNPPVIRGVRMMVRKSEWASQDVNLGGIAEAKAFVPCGAEVFFFLKSRPPATVPPSATQKTYIKFGGSKNEKEHSDHLIAYGSIIPFIGAGSKYRQDACAYFRN